MVEEERGQNKNTAFLALTETWLDNHISDAQLHIEHYNISRSDRQGRIGGGVLLYSHESVPITETRSYDDSICEGIFCKFQTLNVCFILVYRPPEACPSSFSGIISFISTCVSSVGDSCQVCLLGDFNFPFIDWTSGSVASGSGLQMQNSAKQFLELLSKLFLSQYVSVPTRGSNILDLFITNNPFLVTDIKATESILSDHKIVKISTSLQSSNIVDKNVIKNQNDFGRFDFRRADYDLLKKKLLDVEWTELHSSCTQEEFPILFAYVLNQVCEE